MRCHLSQPACDAPPCVFLVIPPVFLHCLAEAGTGSGDRIVQGAGAVNKVFSLTKEQVRQGIITASSGNHALAVLHACSLLQQVRGPEWGVAPVCTAPAPSQKPSGRGWRGRAPTSRTPRMGGTAELQASSDAAALGMTYVSPYNDAQVAGGQGTIALELLAQIERGEMDTLFVPVGGGGLISGIASVMKGVAPEVRIVGCQPAVDDAMRQCVVAGRVVQLSDAGPTLSEGTAGNVEEGSITLQPCMDYVDEWITVEEVEIARAMVSMRREENLSIEGAAATTVGALLKDPCRWKGQKVVLILCGGNVGDAIFQQAEALAASC
eukprot:jgi/Botrbrau1/17126/Bobra.0157s0027.1